jgi:hypothetical protein
MNSPTHCHITDQVNRHTDDYDAPVEGVFDECSSIEDICKKMIDDREVIYQSSTDPLPTTYTPFDIMYERIQENAAEMEVSAKVFAAAMFNEDKGSIATEIAQACDFNEWIFDFFKSLQKQKPHKYSFPKPYKCSFPKPNLDFLNIRGDKA